MADQKCYIATIVILIFVGIALLVGLLSLQCESQKPMTDESICVTKDCSLTAATLISNMDTTTNPCEDFYQFSCGNFISKHPVTPGKQAFSIDDQFYSNFELQLSKLVEEWNSVGEPNVVFRLQEAYHVCLNTTYQRPKELNAFINFTRSILDWPLTIGEKWQPRYKTQGRYLALFEEMGLPNPLVQIYIYSDDSVPPKYVAALTPPELKSEWFKNPEFEKSENDKKEILRHTRDLLVKLLHLLGNNNDKWIDLQIKRTMSLASAIMKYESHGGENGNGAKSEEAGSEEEQSTSDEEDENYSEPEMTSGELFNSTARKVSWTYVMNDERMTFRKLFDITAKKINWADVVNKNIGKRIFTSDDVVNVPYPAYFKKLGKALQKYSLKTFVNLFGLEILFNGVVKHASPDVDSLLKEYVSTTEKYNEDALIDKDYRDKPRWLFCVEAMKDIFNLVLSRLFINKYIDREEKKSADEMIQLVQEAYKRNIKDSNWLDEKTKHAALRKADKIKRLVGYPDAIFDDDALDEIYKDTVPEVQSTHLQNFLLGLRANAKLTVPILNDDAAEEIRIWKEDSGPLDVNAFYLPQKNSIWFPFAILQLPYFQDDRLAAVNYGMVGGVIGHEIGHAFDDSGSQLNEDGKAVNWWTMKTRDIFYKKTRCFIDQYLQYCPEELQGGNESICINGWQTLGENLSDFTGLEAAFLAYRMWVEKHGAEKKLPGLTEYTPEQIFFVGFANSWCENIAPDHWLERYKDDSHSAARYRVIGSVSNSKYFRDTFNCPEGNMNRGQNSCTVW